MKKSLKSLINKKFKLNPNAFLVRGVSRSMICDIERSTYRLIPNILLDILVDENCKTLEKVCEKFAGGIKRNKKIISDYFIDLIEKDLVFFTDYPEYYKKMSLEWDYPAFITNSIIDIEKSSELDFTKAIQQLASLGCRNIQFRFYCVCPIPKIEGILLSSEDTIIESFQFILPFVDEKEVNGLIALTTKYPRIRFIQCYNAPKNMIYYSSKDESTNIVSVMDSLTSNKCCGVISTHYFSIALTTFSEAQKHNTCLNRKISIDAEGNIKNCPSMKESYGNISDTTLQEALEKPSFKKYWNINKDQVEVCKDCEFRYICTDCRAYLEDPENNYSKPLKCGYNPYTCEWEEWSINPLKQKAIEYYGMKELIKKEPEKEIS